jgi:hypothetical protein
MTRLASTEAPRSDNKIEEGVNVEGPCKRISYGSSARMVCRPSWFGLASGEEHVIAFAGGGLLARHQSRLRVRDLAGTDVEKAVVEPGVVAALVEFDMTIRHYEAVEKVPLEIAPALGG